MCSVIQDLQEIIDVYKEEAQFVQRDFAVYALYRRTQGVPLVTAWLTANAEGGSWFDIEVFAVETWMALSETAKEPFRRLQDEDDRRRQLIVDAQTIQQTLTMHIQMERADAMRSQTMNPVAAAATLLATTLTAMHNPEQLPPAPQVEMQPAAAVVIPPSRFNFRSLKKVNGGRFGGFGGASSHRPPAGFTAFVVDTFPALNTSELKHQGLDVYEELIRRWEITAGDADAIAANIAREEELERVGQEQETVRQKKREERQAAMRQQGGGGGFGLGFGGGIFGGASFGSAAPVGNTFGSAATAPVGNTFGSAATVGSVATVPVGNTFGSATTAPVGNSRAGPPSVGFGVPTSSVGTLNSALERNESSDSDPSAASGNKSPTS